MIRIETIRIETFINTTSEFDVGPITATVDPTRIARYTKSTDRWEILESKQYDWDHVRSADSGHDQPVRYMQIYWTDDESISRKLRSPKKLLFDMDGVLCDFEAAAVEILKSRGITRDNTPKAEFKQMISDCQDIDGFYRRLPPIEGAVEAFKELSKHYDCYVCSAPSWTNPSSWTDKHQWVMEHVGEDFAHKRLILTHNKGMFSGRALIDDRVKYNVTEFSGEHVMFGDGLFGDGWRTVLDYLMPRAERRDGFAQGPKHQGRAPDDSDARDARAVRIVQSPRSRAADVRQRHGVVQAPGRSRGPQVRKHAARQHGPVHAQDSQVRRLRENSGAERHADFDGVGNKSDEKNQDTIELRRRVESISILRRGRQLRGGRNRASRGGQGD
jgi:5'-nucleotidase